MKKILSALCVLAIGTTGVFAQTGAESGSRFGHGEDSIRCIQNISIYSEYVKTDNYRDAYKAWKSVFTEAPLAQVSTYTNGCKILRYFIANAKDGKQQKEYFDELMKIYDQRLDNLDALNSLVRRPVSRGKVLGLKAHDYYTMGCPDIKTAYNLFKESVDAEQAKSSYFVLQEFLGASSKVLAKDETHKEQFIDDYMKASTYAAEAEKAQKKAKKQKQYKLAAENIDAVFINSGVATCENLQAIYAPKVKANLDNLDVLKQVIDVMQKLKCTEEEAYFEASEAANAIEPSPATAIGCGYMYYKKGDIDKCVSYFDQAIELEQEDSDKAETCYKAAVALMAKHRYAKAKQYALKATRFNGEYGQPYILLAQMYAANPNWSNEKGLNACTYLAALDKLYQAKRVDSSCEEQANDLIRKYSGYTPKMEDLFFLGYKKGDKIQIGGWIGETVIVR